MTFERLRHLCEIAKPETDYLPFILEWESKRGSLKVNLLDLPQLVVDYKNASRKPYDHNPEITIVDKVPSVRLANACESVSHLVYSMAEIAARFANRVSQAFPQHFNALRTKVRKGELDPAVAEALGDLQWYEKVREIRTEWAHFSSPYVGLSGNDPQIVLRSFRRAADKVHFKDRVTFKVEELSTWASSALVTIDRLADYLLRCLIPTFDYDLVIGQPVRDQNGWPIVKDGILQTEEITAAEFMFRYGILERCDTIDHWSKELSVPVDVLRNALKDEKGMTGPLRDGTIVENGFYSERVVRNACKHLIKIVLTVAPQPKSAGDNTEIGPKA